MSWISKFEEEYRQSPVFNIQFSIDPEKVDPELDEHVMFGENESHMEAGNSINFQPVIYDGEFVGNIREFASYNWMKPLVTTYMIPLVDCKYENLLTDEMLESPHFCDEGWETYSLHFATLRQMIDYWKQNRNELRELYRKQNWTL